MYPKGESVLSKYGSEFPLTNLDANSLIEEVMGGDPTSFVVVVSTVLDEDEEWLMLTLYLKKILLHRNQVMRRARVLAFHIPNLQELQGQGWQEEINM